MKLLILCPGKLPKSKKDIQCFTDVVNFYLPISLEKIIDTDILQIPMENSAKLKEIFSTIDVSKYDAILTLGLRYYSKIPKEIALLLKNRFNGLFCQIHDGTRLDHDPVDITFTFKNDDLRMHSNLGWYERHKKSNVYMGWAADSELNYPSQDSEDLRILIDHTNYGENPVDNTVEIINTVKQFIDSKIWQSKYKSVSVRRFDSGKVIDVDFDNVDIERYDRTPIPFTEITKEHSQAHIFMVTHPESVGLVVLETAMAGALTVTPDEFIPDDRLDTVRYYKYNDTIDWKIVLDMLNPQLSREVALQNNWDAVACRIADTLIKRRKK